jgi:hypothetical protein
VAVAASTATAAAGLDGEVPEDLNFSGALSGHLTKAHRGNAYICAGGNLLPKNPNTTGQLAVGPIVGALGGKEVQLNITKIDYHGPGTYNAGGVSFEVGTDHYFPVSAPSGTVTVNPDGRSGTVTVDLALNGKTTSPVGHVQGAWQCPADGF